MSQEAEHERIVEELNKKIECLIEENKEKQFEVRESKLELSTVVEQKK